MRYRLITFLVFGAVLVGIGEWAVKNHRLQSLNRWWLDFCVGNAGDRISEPAVTFVRIADDYKPLMSETLSRIDYAAVLGFLAEFEPVSVAFEPALEFDETLPVNDQNAPINPLKEFALQLPEMTLGCIVENGQPPAKPQENVEFPVISQVEGAIEKVTPLTRTVGAPDAKMLANGTPGFTVIELGAEAESDGIRIPLVARQGDKLVPGFVVQALARHAGVALDAIAATFGDRSSVITIGDRYTIPIDAKGRMKIYEYSGVQRQPPALPVAKHGNRKGWYKNLTAFELIATGDSDPEMKDALSDLLDEFESLKTNLVVVGDDHSANRHIEFANGGPAISQAELITRAIATIQSGRYIERWPAWARYLAVAAIALLALFLFRFSRAKVVIVGLLAALLFFFVVVTVFVPTLSWTPPFSLMSLFGLALVVGLILPGPGHRAGDESEPAEKETDESTGSSTSVEESAAEKSEPSKKNKGAKPKGAPKSESEAKKS